MSNQHKPQIKLSPVKSSSLKSVGYDAATKTLAVQFVNGGIFHYADVSQKAADDLLKADSVGSHFAKHIRLQYTSTKQHQPQGEKK